MNYGSDFVDLLENAGSFFLSEIYIMGLFPGFLLTSQLTLMQPYNKITGY